jgi:hypothetical protein
MNVRTGAMLTFFCGTQSEDYKRIKRNAEYRVHTRSGAVIDKLAFDRCHDWVVYATAKLKDTETPHRNAFIAKMAWYEKACRCDR